VAFVPPALAIIVPAFYWLHNRFVLFVAGEHEPRADARLSQSAHFDPVAAASLVRPAFIALGLGACLGAALVTSFLFLSGHSTSQRFRIRAQPRFLPNRTPSSACNPKQ